ncbi:MAG: hypothetical protein LC097_09645 [Burkholderiales bacterium]|nr:hypothetical protein [Burkholderiales bacterium]
MRTTPDTERAVGVAAMGAMSEAIDMLTDAITAMREEASHNKRRTCWQADILRPIHERLTNIYFEAGGAEVTTPGWGYLPTNNDDIPF